MYKLIFLALVGLALANPVEKREGEVAEARDTSSSYAAPAPAATYDTGSQGNLYYYYYPVEEYGSTEASGGDFDIFTAIILPLLILGGLLLLLSSLTFTLTTGRALSEETKGEPDLMEQLHTEIERVFYIYLNAFESEQCLQRTICEMGAYSKEFKGKDFVLNMVEPLVPEGMKGNLAIFKKAAESGYETGKCRKYRCIAPKLM